MNNTISSFLKENPLVQIIFDKTIPKIYQFFNVSELDFGVSGDVLMIFIKSNDPVNISLENMKKFDTEFFLEKKTKTFNKIDVFLYE